MFWFTILTILFLIESAGCGYMVSEKQYGSAVFLAFLALHSLVGYWAHTGYLWARLIALGD